MTTTTPIAFGVLSILLALAAEIRIDTFDKHFTTDLIINQQTGRIDQYDVHSNRLGYGTTTPTQPGYGRGLELLDRNGHPISINRRDR
jgi:hypothetical protein